MRASPVVMLHVHSKTRSRWLGPKSNSQSRHSARRVSTQRSAKALALAPDRRSDHADPSDAKTSIEGSGKLGVSVANEKADLRTLVGQAHHEVPRLLGDKG